MIRNASWRQIVAVATFSTFGSTFAMSVAMGTSYGTQVELFLAHAVGWAAYAVPATIDVIALMSNLALGLPRRKGFSRGGLWFIMILTLTVSAALNFWAGANFIASTAHVWVVVAYLAAEYVRGWVARYRAEVKDENEEITTAKQEAVTEVTADEAASPHLPEAPISPAAPRQRGEYGPRDPQRGYAASTVRAKKATARKAVATAE
jgi:hypothetical protein